MQKGFIAQQEEHHFRAQIGLNSAVTAATVPCKNKSRRYRVNRGFTLIEILVVIGIIVLLAAILFPVFARARESARRSSCQSNLKQIGLGLMQYIQDNDEQFPPIIHSPQVGWRQAIDPYIKSHNIFQCPSEEDTEHTGYDYTDYYVNANLSYYTGTVLKGIHQASLTAPAVTVTLGDGTYGQTWVIDYPVFDDHGVGLGGTSGRDYYARNSVYGEPYNTNPGHSRHLDGGNYAFADGHVKWLKQEKIYWAKQTYLTSPAIGTPENIGTYQATFLVQ